MFSHAKSFRWSIMAFCIVMIVMLFSLHFDRAQFTTSKLVNSFEAASFISKDENYKLQVQESVLNLSKVDALSDKYDIAVTHPSLQWTEQDLAFFKSAAGETVFSQLALIPEAHLAPNFATITAAERLFKALFLHFDKILAKDPSQDLQQDPSWIFFKRLENALYPWIYPYWDNVFHINNQTSGKGIVLCVGNDQFKFAASTIRIIREVYHNDLPIEVFFIRENDLDNAKRHYLISEFKDLTLMKLDDYIGDYYTRFGGWAMKPFAMLASKFSEMIMMDADVFFFQDPGMLFEDEGYKTTGSLFYYDRTLFPNWTKGPDWMRSFLPTMSSFVPKSRWFRGLSSHEQESGVVVMDKKKALIGLLSSCKMNGVTERNEVVYKHVYGDKETYWVGFEVTQTSYAFVKSFASVIGSHGRGDADGSPEYICGNQIHFDANGKPLWLNGGLYRNKHAKDRLEYLNFTHYSISTGDDWEFEANCIKNKDTIHDLDPVQKIYALASVEIDKKCVLDQELLDKNEWKFKDAV